MHLLPRAAVLSDNDDEKDAALPDFLNVLETHSFVNIEVTDIGDKVWRGYDKWTRQNEPDIWDTNWRVAYEKNLLDYYIVKTNLRKSEG